MQEVIDLYQDDGNVSLERVSSDKWETIVISSWFDPHELVNPCTETVELSSSTKNLLDVCSKSLNTGGLLFIYGAPQRLPAYAEFLDSLDNEEWRLEFKYWIGIQLHAPPEGETLYPSHVGVLLFHKVSRKTKKTGFKLNLVRIPHQYCTACERNLRDWGGKKHLMNPRGTALSDIWLDLQLRSLIDNRVPEDVFERIKELASSPSNSLLHIIEHSRSTDTILSRPSQESAVTSVTTLSNGGNSRPKLVVDRVEQADCIEFLEGLLPKYADNAFDLVFADPPYNLDKLYLSYSDSQAAEEYIAWCDRWLELSVRLLKPGGTMFILNLPKWALKHARTVEKLIHFRHWIAWSALGEPRGKLLPAHYALLYYTKPGAPHVFNYSEHPSEEVVEPIDSPEYCLRASCINQRKKIGEDKKVTLSDIWFDIHRIKQLPEKLLERVILLSSKPGQVVFDPFCGVGTTAIVAKRLGRHYVTTDIDPNYVKITRDKLSEMELSKDLFGKYINHRSSIRKQSRDTTKKQIEVAVQKLALELGHMPELEDLERVYPELHEAVFELYRNPRKALGAARVVLND
jgi:DNA modification methylase